MEGFRVLLVDDEEEFSSTLAERLNMRGFSTLISSGGEEALGMIDACQPQVVLLDMMMPGLGGKDVLAEIKRKHPDILVIFLTGLSHGEPGPERVDYLIKPVNIDELIQKIRSISARG